MGLLGKKDGEAAASRRSAPRRPSAPKLVLALLKFVVMPAKAA